MVDPDGWLKAMDRLHIKRTVRANGSVSVDKHDYSIKASMKGERVVLHLDA
jgi:hypothetical protein